MARELSTPKQFFDMLEGEVRLVAQYARQEKLERALAVMPVSALRERAHAAFVAQSAPSTSVPPSAVGEQPNASTAPVSKDALSEQECLMLELLHWFKEAFFSWFDQPQACESCGATQFEKGEGSPTQQDLMCAHVIFHSQFFSNSYFA